MIRFNPNGANTPVEIQLKYSYQGIAYAVNEDSIIGTSSIHEPILHTRRLHSVRCSSERMNLVLLY